MLRAGVRSWGQGMTAEDLRFGSEPTWHEEAEHSAAMEDSHDLSALV